MIRDAVKIGPTPGDIVSPDVGTRVALALDEFDVLELVGASEGG